MTNADMLGALQLSVMWGEVYARFTGVDTGEEGDRDRFTYVVGSEPDGTGHVSVAVALLRAALEDVPLLLEDYRPHDTRYREHQFFREVLLAGLDGRLP